MSNIEDNGFAFARQGIQGVRGERGYNGKSAYEAALAGGFRGTELEFNGAMANMAECLTKITMNRENENGSKYGE